LEEEKHVLLIAYYWPPSGGAGVQRWLKMLKYLSKDNVKCTVITVDHKKASYPILDESLLNEIEPNIHVITTSTREPLNAYKKVTNSKETPYAGFANESNPSALKKFARWIRANFFIPDARKGWNKFAYRKAVELINNEKIDTVITTSPPHSTQLTGLKLKRKLNIRWIADIRDPWTDIYYSDLFPQMDWAKRKDQKYERKVLENSDEVIVVSQAIKNLFLNKGKVSQSKIHVIPNGYDHVDFLDWPSADSSNKDGFKIVYTGTMSDQYPIDSFTDALSNLKEKIDLSFAGKISKNAQKKLEAHNSNFLGYIPHSESLLELKKADALLLVIPQIENNEGILTGKLFEYLGSMKPIILIGPIEGDAARIVNICRSGCAFDYSDSKGIFNYLEDLISRKSQGQELHSPNREEIRNYSRKNLASEVRKLL
jgi:glycosyltransferase involved in cell wall biosynthesis